MYNSTFERPYQHELKSPQAQEQYSLDRNVREAGAKFRAARKNRRAKWLRRPDLSRG
jgi:hypothetical protein